MSLWEAMLLRPAERSLPGMTPKYDGLIGPSDPEYDYPAYIKAMYKQWLNGMKTAPSDDEANWDHSDYMNVADEMQAVSAEVGGSPFEYVTAYDPQSDLDMIQTAVDDLRDEVDIVPATEVNDAVLEAIELVNDQLFSDTSVAALVDSYEDRRLPSFQRDISRVAAGFFDIQATMSSQYAMAFANMENARRADIADFEAKLRLQFQQQKMSTAIALTSEMLRLKSGRASGRQVVAAMQMDLSKMRIVAMQDQINIDLGFIERNALWNLDLFKHGSSVLGSITGSTVLPRAQTPMERLLGGLATGASAGIQAGIATGNPMVGVASGIIFAMANMFQGGQY